MWIAGGCVVVFLLAVGFVAAVFWWRFRKG